MALDEIIANKLANKIVKEHEALLRLCETFQTLRGIDVHSLDEHDLEFLYGLIEPLNFSGTQMMYTLMITALTAKLNSE